MVKEIITISVLKCIFLQEGQTIMITYEVLPEEIPLCAFNKNTGKKLSHYLHVYLSSPRTRNNSVMNLHHTQLGWMAAHEELKYTPHRVIEMQLTPINFKTRDLSLRAESDIKRITSDIDNTQATRSVWQHSNQSEID